MSGIITAKTIHNRSLIQGSKIIKMAFMGLVVLGVAHIVIGSNPIVPGLAIITILLAMWPMMRFGVMNISVILVMLTAFRYVGFPMIAKLFMGQALDTHLDQPIESFIAVMLGIMAYVSAVFLANKINLGKPFLKSLNDQIMLRRLSFVAFVVGFSANLDASSHAYIEYDGLTISNFFTPFLHLSLISASASALLRNDRRSITDPLVFFILTTEIIFAFALNVRTPILESFLCIILTTAAFNGHFSKKQITYGLVSFLLLVAITPMVLHVRNTRSDLNMSERIIETFETILDWKTAQSTFIDSMARESLSSGYFMRYYDMPNNVFERFSHVNDVDVLISGTDNIRMLGFEVIEQAMERALPRILAPDKPREYSEGDWIYCELGVKCLYGNYLTASMIGVGYVAFGWVGVFIFPFMLGLILLLLVKKVVGFDLIGNVWTIFFLVAINNQFAEGGVASYISMIFRNIPQDLIVMIFLSILVAITRIRAS